MPINSVQPEEWTGPVIEMAGIRRSFRMGSEDIHAVAGVDLTVRTG